MFTLLEVMKRSLFENYDLCIPVSRAVVAGIFSGDFYLENGYVYEDLDEMPFDVWDEELWSFVHATGRAYWDGLRWENEYEHEI